MRTYEKGSPPQNAPVGSAHWCDFLCALLEGIVLPVHPRDSLCVHTEGPVAALAKGVVHSGCTHKVKQMHWTHMGMCRRPAW